LPHASVSSQARDDKIFVETEVDIESSTESIGFGGNSTCGLLRRLVQPYARSSYDVFPFPRNRPDGQVAGMEICLSFGNLGGAPTKAY
jgi:hypothetical protein